MWLKVRKNQISAQHKIGFSNSYRCPRMPFTSLGSSEVSAFGSVQSLARQALNKDLGAIKFWLDDWATYSMRLLSS